MFSPHNERVAAVARILRTSYGESDHHPAAATVADAIVSMLFPASAPWSSENIPSGDCTVILNSYADGHMVRIIKAIRALGAFSLKDAKYLCDDVLVGRPRVVLANVSDEYAQHAKNLLNAAGGMTVIRNEG